MTEFWNAIKRAWGVVAALGLALLYALYTRKSQQLQNAQADAVLGKLDSELPKLQEEAHETQQDADSARRRYDDLLKQHEDLLRRLDKPSS